ncbi:MAG: LysR family transcriptional regulator [Candidatus Latescibacteria bacterium]|nr:LysR family transcriptional regulator [Candidatus Latescibacterota bacterium]NIO78238.1 LysR family transcriptional regulator [Candidatus Latescibacterota bacterium]
MNLNHLHYFYVVAKNRSFTGASRELMVSQSSLSIQMKQFETALGQKLFHRKKTGVDLTEPGEIVYQSAERIFQEVERLSDLLEQVEHQIKGSIAIGTVNSIGIYMLPDLLKEFKEAYPDVRITIDFKNAREVIDMVHSGKIDFAIITWNRKYGDLASFPIQTNKMFLVSPPDHPLAGKDGLSPRELEKYPFIGYEEGTPSRTMMDSLFKRMSLNVDYTIESGNVATMKHMVLAGLGLAVLPNVAIGQEIRDGRLIRLEVPTMVMAQEITLYYKKSRPLAPTKQEFLKFLGNRRRPLRVRKR